MVEGGGVGPRCDTVERYLQAILLADFFELHQVKRRQLTQQKATEEREEHPTTIIDRAIREIVENHGGFFNGINRLDM